MEVYPLCIFSSEQVRIGENVTLPDNIVLVSAAVAKTLPEDECKRAGEIIYFGFRIHVVDDCM